VRALLVEAVWRFLQWQPHWKAAGENENQAGRGHRHEEKDRHRPGPATAIDLWRWRTGRCTLEELGWIPA